MGSAWFKDNNSIFHDQKEEHQEKGSRRSIRPPSSDCETQAEIEENGQAGRAKYNINLLKDQTIQGAFTVTLRNRFQVLQELTTNDTDAHNLWKGTKEALIETCQEVLGPKKNQHKDWISVDTLQKIQVSRLKKEAVNVTHTRASKAAAQAGYTEAHKEVKRSVKKDK